MLTAQGKEYESRVTAAVNHLGALRSYATVTPGLCAEPVATVSSVAPGLSVNRGRSISSSHVTA
jgi:hypothetical protein